MQQRERATFDAGELAVVLSYYDLGVIQSVTEMPRGSQRSPKVGIVSDRGKFLLKRRTVERTHPHRILFTHRVHDFLVQANYPVARVIPTADRKRTFVQVREHWYELFEYVGGQSFTQTVGESRDAGEWLARFHAATEPFQLPRGLRAPQGDYHDSPAVRAGVGAISSTLKAHDSFAGDEAELAGLLAFCAETYEDAADRVNSLGYEQWTQRLIHGDWHPGNLLFRNGKVVAVVDYDSARLSRRALDIANGALHFSMLSGNDPADWPDHLDEPRFSAFLQGYEAVSPIFPGERSAVSSLMAEALIAECVAPIAATGSVGRWSGIRMLRMMRRKLTWLGQNSSRLIEAIPPE